MITEADIPCSWTEALQAIRQLHPEAVIGGGCLRDLDNGRPVKDIDIFVRGAVADRFDELRSQLIATGYEVGEIDAENMYPVGDGNDVVGFFEMGWGEGPPLQIIMVNFPCDRIVERFDYGICRISFDGQALKRSPDYLSDQAAQVFRICRSREERELIASVHRYARLSRKYEGWTWQPYVDPNDIWAAALG